MMKASGYDMNSEGEMLRDQHRKLKAKVKRLASAKNRDMMKVGAAIAELVAFETKLRAEHKL